VSGLDPESMCETAHFGSTQEIPETTVREA
jgi:hypothetical protein